MRIWQFQHLERMSIMALLGAPIWLRSAVLFRLSIVDSIIAILLVNITFLYLRSNSFILETLKTLNVQDEEY